MKSPKHLCMRIFGAGLLFSVACLGFDAEAASKGKSASVRRPAIVQQKKPTPVQRPVIRYKSVGNLPSSIRRELIQENLTPEGSLFDASSDQALPSDCNSPQPGKIAPCLGLNKAKATTRLKLRFDLVQTSIGAPKNLLFGPCRDCTDVLSSSDIEQEKTADALNKQRRFPLATMGIALSF